MRTATVLFLMIGKLLMAHATEPDPAYYSTPQLMNTSNPNGLNHSSSFGCNDPDYIYWPLIIDSNQFFLEKVYKFFAKEDSLLKEIEILRKKATIHNEWRTYYNIFLRYRELEKICINMHPQREKLYRKLKSTYHELATSIRTDRMRKRLKTKAKISTHDIYPEKFHPSSPKDFQLSQPEAYP